MQVLAGGRDCGRRVGGGAPDERALERRLDVRGDPLGVHRPEHPSLDARLDDDRDLTLEEAVALREVVAVRRVVGRLRTQFDYRRPERGAVVARVRGEHVVDLAAESRLGVVLGVAARERLAVVVEHEREEVQQQVVSPVVVVVEEGLALRELVADPLDRQARVAVFAQGRVRRLHDGRAGVCRFVGEEVGRGHY
jgi:hypothetical protein